MDKIVQLKSYTEEGIEIDNVFPITKSEGILLTNGKQLEEKLNEIDEIKENNKNINAQLEQNKYETKLINSNLNTPVPTVVFTTDDGAISDWTKLKPLSEKYNIPFVSAVYRNCPNTSNLKYLQDTLGWEIAGHNQYTLLGRTEEQIKSDLLDTINFCKEQDLKLKNHVYANSGHSELIRKITSEYFRSACQVGGGINTCPITQFNIKRIALGSFFDAVDITGKSLSTSSLEYYKACVDKTISSNGLCIFMLHPDEQMHNEIQQQYLDDTIAYCKSLNVNITTLDKAMDLFANRRNVGDYHDINSSDNYSVIGANGILKSKTKGNEIINYTYVTNNITNISTPSDFPSEFSVKTFLTSDNGGFPTSAGNLVTFKDEKKYNSCTFQLWYPYGNSNIYKRDWNGSWTTWTQIGGTSTTSYFKIEGTNGHSATSLPTDFASKTITITPINTAGATGFPSNSAGILETYNVDSDTNYIYQKYKQYNNNATYSRTFKNGAWDSWYMDIKGFPSVITTITTSINANSTYNEIINISGIGYSDIVIVAPYVTTEDALYYRASIETPGQVRLKITNLTGNTVSLNSKVVRIMVLKTTP